MYIDTGSSVLYIPSKSLDLADENNKILTEWKRFETTVLIFFQLLKFLSISGIFPPKDHDKRKLTKNLLKASVGTIYCWIIVFWTFVLFY